MARKSLLSRKLGNQSTDEVLETDEKRPVGRPSGTNNKVATSFYMTPEMKRSIQLIAIDSGRKMNTVMEDAIQFYIDNVGNPGR